MYMLKNSVKGKLQVLQEMKKIKFKKIVLTVERDKKTCSIFDSCKNCKREKKREKKQMTKEKTVESLNYIFTL